MRIIGVDLGTTTIKGTVLDLDSGRLQHDTRRPFPGPVSGLPRLHYEVDPRAIVAELRIVLDELLARAPDCAGLTFCSQMHGLVLVDDDGRPLTNVITWQDQRAATVSDVHGRSWLDALKSRISADDVRRTGNDLWAMRPLSVLFWMAQNGALPHGATMLSLPDFVAAQLCGLRPRDGNVATDIGHAAATSCVNLEAGDWHRPLLEKLGLGDVRLPRIVARDNVIGEWRVGGRTIPVYPPLADQQCSLLGAGLQRGELSINVSTGSQVGMLSDSLAFGNFQTRPYFGGKTLLTCIHIPAGRSLNALVRLLTELAAAEGVTLQRVWDNIEAMAQRAGDSELDVDLSFFGGALGNEGAISRITEENLNVGAVFRAAFGSMARNFKAMALRLSPSQNWSRIVFSGGLVLQSRALREQILREFNCDFRLAEGGEDALMGILADARSRRS